MYDYEAFYKKYPVNQHDFPERHLVISQLIKGRAIDIGCGTASLADYFLGDYTGYDISSEAIKRAKLIRRQDTKFFVGDFTKLNPFDFSNYNTIILSEFLEHIEDDLTIFKSILETATYGTRLIITVPNGDRIPCDEHVREFTVPELRKRFAPYGRVRFHNWSGFKQQIICTVDLKEPQDNKLGLVMIVKNEEKGLENAILSVIDLVDEVTVAVDSSTTDGTHKIAKRYADNLKTFTWEDNFAKARNEAQEGAKMEWLMFLDGHEYLKERGNLEEYLKLDYDGLQTLIELESGSQFPNPRIYRNGFKFEGAVHERQNLERVLKAHDIVIQHNRIKGQTIEAVDLRRQQTTEMVPRIMGQQLKENKKNIRASFHLALFYQATGNFKKAIKYQKIYLKYSKLPPERWFILFNQMLCRLSLKQNFRALMSLKNAEVEDPGRWEVAKFRGLIYFQNKQYDRAIEYFVHAFDKNKGSEIYKPLKQDTAEIWNLIGELYFNQLNYYKAGVAFDAAFKNSSNKLFKKLLKKRSELMFKIAGVVVQK